MRVSLLPQFLPFSGPAKPMNPIMRRRLIPILALLIPGSDGDSSTTIGNSPGALSGRLMLQKWPRCERTDVHLSSLLQDSAGPWSARPAEFSEAGEPDYFRCIHFPLDAAALPPATAHARINPTLTCHTKQGSGNLCKCYGCLTRMLEHLIQSR